MGPRLYSGWGVRTLAEGEGRYNPIGYHLGTVWPFDNSFIAWGLRDYGYKEEAARIASDILDAAVVFEGRLPEAFGGYDRARDQVPGPVPDRLQPAGVVDRRAAAPAADDARARADRRPPRRRSGAARGDRPSRAARHPRPLGPARRVRSRAGPRRAMAIGNGNGSGPRAPEDGTMTDGSADHQGRHRRRRVRRHRLRPRAGEARRRPRDAHRQERLPPVPAAPVPGRDIDAVPRDIAYPLRKIAAEYKDFEVEARRGGEDRPGGAHGDDRHAARRYAGDYLVLAAGSQPSFFGTPGAEHAFPLYSLDDAERLRTRIIQAFEEADRDPSLIDQGAHRLRRSSAAARPASRSRARSSEMIATTMAHEFPALAPRRAKSTSSTTGRAAHDVRRQGPRLHGARSSTKDGVELLLGDGVTGIGPGHVTLSDGRRSRHAAWSGAVA